MGPKIPPVMAGLPPKTGSYWMARCQGVVEVKVNITARILAVGFLVRDYSIPGPTGHSA